MPRFPSPHPVRSGAQRRREGGWLEFSRARIGKGGAPVPTLAMSQSAPIFPN